MNLIELHILQSFPVTCINRAVSAANASLYALTTAVGCSLGYLPQLGFIHDAGTLPFVFDVADIYKPETTLVAAFHTLGIRQYGETNRKALTVGGHFLVAEKWDETEDIPPC